MTPRVADAVAGAIYDAGTRWAFGHPGGEVVTLIDALRKTGITFVLTHHEASAAFAAAGYAELTGRPGVCVATLGPGATNLVTGVASALLERAPILALTGKLAESGPAGATHQRLDLHGMFSAIAKDSRSIDGGHAADITSSALSTALAERPGPVHLALAADVAALADPHAASIRGTEVAPAPAPLPQAGGAAMDRGRVLLAASRRPVIVSGLTAARLRLEGSVRACAEMLGAPVVVTPKAKGLVPDGHPWFLGVVDMAGDGLISEVLDRADVILAVGNDVVELDRRWSWPAPVIHIDVAPNTDGYYAAEVELVGDIAATLAMLTDGVQPGDWTAGEVSAQRAALLDHIRPASSRMQPWHVLERVQAHAGPGALATCDVGAHKMLVGQLWRTQEPRDFLMANGLSSMGYSVPTAMAASLVDPGRRVVAFVGDGGLGMYLGELETLVRVGAKLTIVVFADRSLELIRRAEIRRDVSTGSVTFDNPDFEAIGRAFGITASEVTTVAELEEALTRSDAGNGVHLIAARIDGADYRF